MSGIFKIIDLNGVWEHSLEAISDFIYDLGHVFLKYAFRSTSCNGSKVSLTLSIKIIDYFCFNNLYSKSNLFDCFHN